MKFIFSIDALEKMEKNPWFTDRQRKIFDLYYRRGWSIEEIAAEIDRQRSVVDRELKSIRGKSREMLQD